MTSPSPRSPAVSCPSPAEGGGAEFVPPPSAGEGPPRSGRERGRKDVLRDLAKSMRSAPTEAEHRLWQLLRAKRLAGYRFKRQLVIDHYIADFACLRERLIVECDGSQHADSERDLRRDTYLQSQGFRILRIWNNELFNNEEGVTELIYSALHSPPLPGAARHPSPSRGEGMQEAP